MMLRPFKLLLALALLIPSAACSSKDKGAPQPDTPGSVEAGAAEDDAAAPAEALPDAAELLAAHVEASGGADKIEKIDSLHASGKVDTGEQKLVGTMEVWWQKGGKFYLEQEIEGVGKSRAGYDGNTIWIDDPITGLRELHGEEAESYIQTSIMFPGHDWQKYFSAAKTVAKRKLGDGEVWEVELVSDGGPNMIVGLDVDSKLIRYIKNTQVTLMGKLPIEAHTVEYRDVEGYKFAVKKRSAIKSLIQLEEEITNLEVNVPVDESKFAFPVELESVNSDPSEQPPVVAPKPEGGKAEVTKDG